MFKKIYRFLTERCLDCGEKLLIWDEKNAFCLKCNKRE